MLIIMIIMDSEVGGAHPLSSFCPSFLVGNEALTGDQCPRGRVKKDEVMFLVSGTLCGFPWDELGQWQGRKASIRF